MTKQGPFRADHVGSLLRPAALLEKRAGHAAGRVSDAELKAAEDAAITAVIAKQEEVGLKSITDGEFRRENWTLDFLSQLQGVKVEEMATAPRGHGSSAPLSNVLKVARAVGKIGLGDHPMVDHFKFLKATTRQTAKITIPCPTMMVSAARDWRQIIPAYSDLDEFYADIAAAYRVFMGKLYDAGCRYLQLDDVNLSYLCDADMREKIKARGDDPESLLSSWIKTLNAVLQARPADMTITTHICRGNFKSAWFASGGYEPIAERIFNELDYDGYFLEYDSDRAGGFEPLRFLPKGKKRVVLGLITSKTGDLEPVDLIKSRVEAAGKFASVDQFCVSPQCGFASHEDGNLLSADDQWRKLARVVEIAREIWPDA
ncbi:MAG: 5-methyltetrahydropteroyltriglutamate--homocysteine S-methyltransferase [Hyphomonadaceae bacterium]|nr:5-methyltetrahydropteroyltriglutamate--homocysteine S-methyltransferase [Hyphomonadaceae bacterium]